MPKRGRGRGGSRGGSRGGRGGGRGSGRGGYIGGKHNKYNKRRRNRGNDNAGPGTQRDFPELFDMNNPDFVSVSHPERSMRAAAARGSRRKFKLQDEVFNTEDNMENTMKLPLRKRPVEFVKASVLDPSKDIIRKLREKEDYLEKINNNEVTFVRDEPIADDHDNEKVDGIELRSGVTYSDDQKQDESVGIELEGEHSDISIEEAESEEFQQPSSLPPVVESGMESVPDDMLFFRDDDGVDITQLNIKTVEVEEPAKRPKAPGNTEFNPTLSIGHVYLSTNGDKTDNLYTSLPQGKSKSTTLDVDQSIYELAGDDEDYLDFNKNSSKDLYQSYNKYISRVMQNLNGSDDEEDDDEEEESVDDTNDREMFAELDDDFEEEARFISNIDDSDSDNEDDQQISQIGAVDKFEKLQIKESEEDKDPEYGFLPEDYESFDNSSVDVINVRFGASSNQYFMKSFRLLGSYDFSWVDQELFQDFLLENGLPEHRLNAYFKYIQAQLTPADEPEEKDFDIEFSDSDSEEDIEEGRDDFDDEGLDDLIKYTTKYDGLRDVEFDTKTLKTRGKGRKKELNLDHIADDDLRQSLADQYQAQKRNRKDKRKERESNIAHEHYTSKDLSEKYPYTFHVKDFRHEFEEFLMDSKRNALTFPPLDPHGNKVVMKFAFLYNMKSRKFGKGRQQHVVAVKNKRTFHSLPDYHSVGLLCKQRPIFNRTDQKRPRVEIEAEEAKSSRRGKPSKAHVKEGDIVGADAPEIATDNIGRRLLEKLGWKSGQGLGADNRGIPEPVIAKVKKTKLGLR